MSGNVIFVIGGGVIAAAVAYIFWPQWQQRLPKRKHKPMPPLNRRVPGLPVDTPDTPLTPHEHIAFLLLSVSCKDPDIVAADPMEQP